MSHAPGADAVRPAEPVFVSRAEHPPGGWDPLDPDALGALREAAALLGQPVRESERLLAFERADVAALRRVLREAIARQALIERQPDELTRLSATIHVLSQQWQQAEAQKLTLEANRGPFRAHLVLARRGTQGGNLRLIELQVDASEEWAAYLKGLAEARERALRLHQRKANAERLFAVARNRSMERTAELRHLGG